MQQTGVLALNIDDLDPNPYLTVKAYSLCLVFPGGCKRKESETTIKHKATCILEKTDDPQSSSVVKTVLLFQVLL